MKVKEFVEKLKHIESLPTTYYSVAGGDWAKWNGKSWNFDCVILIKAILWGWNENKNHSHGGANYGSNGVYDDGSEQIIKRCSNVSSDFSNIEVGELLWLPGHVGIYVGNGQVIECTAAWESKVLYSTLDSNGKRVRNGRQVLAWEKHGKLPYIDYSENTKTTNTTQNTTTKLNYKVGDVVNINGVYVSSSSTEKLNPAVKQGKITKIVEGARNPYLLDNGNIGWVNDNCIVNDTTKYLSNKSYTGGSIVDALNQIGVDSSFNNRAKLAKLNGITNYSGTAEQNTKLLNLLKQGKLKG